MGNVHTAGPNEAIVVSGGCCGSTVRTLVVGGWAWAWWSIADVQRLSMEVLTIRPRCKDVKTAQGLSLNVTGVAHCKVMTEPELIAVACENFLGKEIDFIKVVILEILEGQMTAVLGTLTVDEVYKDRDQLASLVREVAAPEIGRYGIEILCFTIKDVSDDMGYLSSLGKARIAALQRDAEIGMTVVEAKQNTSIRDPDYENASLAWKQGYNKA